MLTPAFRARSRPAVFIAAILATPTPTARADDLSTARDRLFLQRDVALTTLGAWAGANLVAGALLVADPPWMSPFGPSPSFRRAAGVGTLSFAAVNGALSIIGAFTLFRSRDATSSLSAIAQQRSTATTIFAVNAGLDVLYVGAGALLYTKGTTDTLRGFGASVMVQGSFLFGFDTTNALVFRYAGP